MDKDVFFKWLKENNFTVQWILAYNLDNKICNDDVPLDIFFEKVKPISWFYSGLGCLVWSEKRSTITDKTLLEEWRDFRRDNSSRILELDEKWMDFVRNYKNN